MILRKNSKVCGFALTRRIIGIMASAYGDNKMEEKYEKFVNRYENHAVLSMFIWSIDKADYIIDELIKEGYQLGGFSKSFMIIFIWWFQKRPKSN